MVSRKNKPERQDNDVVRQIQIDKLGQVATFTLRHKAVKVLSVADAKALEEGFVERTRDFNQGRNNSELEVPTKSTAFWKGYELARQQEPRA